MAISMLQAPSAPLRDMSELMRGNAMVTSMYTTGLNTLHDVANNIKNEAQKNYNTDYLRAMSKYSNNPQGLSEALASGAIDNTHVDAATLSKAPEILASYANNAKDTLAYNTAKAKEDFMTSNKGTIDSYLNAVKNGDLSGASDYSAQLASMQGYNPLWFADKNALPNYINKGNLAVSQTNANSNALLAQLQQNQDSRLEDEYNHNKYVQDVANVKDLADALYNKIGGIINIDKLSDADALDASREFLASAEGQLIKSKFRTTNISDSQLINLLAQRRLKLKSLEKFNSLGGK